MVSVLTLNLRFGLANDGPSSWKYRKEIYPAFLKNHPVDFIALQEVNDFQSDELEKILSGYNFIGKRTPAPVFWQNNIIFYKKSWSCLYHEHFYLSPTPSIPSRFHKSRWPRQCTLGVFTKKDRKLICINTHFDFDVSVRMLSADLILKRLSRLPADIPAVLLGDFNATPFSPCYQVFAGQNPYHLKFNNIFNEPYPGTQHGFTGNVRGEHIDWILYRGGIRLQRSAVITQNYDGLYPSDHFPLEAFFRWK